MSKPTELTPEIIKQVEEGKLDIETFLTSAQTPSFFVDPITGVLFKNPVILPSGKSTSKHIADAKSNIDIFTNVAFSQGQSLVPNLHLKEFVDDYMEKEMVKFVDGITTSVSMLKQFAVVLSLMHGRTDLNCVPNTYRTFMTVFTQQIRKILPLTEEFSEVERKVFYEALSRDSFPAQQVLELFDTGIKELVMLAYSLFPSDQDCYKALNFGTMLKGEDTGKAIKRVHLLYQHTQTNLMDIFYKSEGEEQLYSLLQCAAQSLEKDSFYHLIAKLPIQLASKDLDPVHYAKLAEQEYKIKKITETNTQITQQVKQLQQQTQQLEAQNNQQTQQINQQKQQIDLQTQQIYQQAQQLQQAQQQQQPNAQLHPFLQKIQATIAGNNCGSWGPLYYCSGKCANVNRVWGSNPYTYDSNRCSSAKHAGFTPGFFTLDAQTQYGSYTSSVSNGITSSNYGNYQGHVYRQVS